MFDIGPVDFPDVAHDQKATGARFLNAVRGYSGTGMDNVEHYCLDCSFRPWLDATDDVVARVRIVRARGGSVVETLRPDSDGRFETQRTLGAGDRASIAIEDAWGDASGAPVAVGGGGA